MHIQLVTFHLEGISDADLRAGAEAIAPQFAALPGLQSKVWLADPTANTYGGLYSWEDRASMETYLEGDLYATAVRDNPAFRGVQTRDFSAIEAPTHITGLDRPAAVL